MAKNRAAKVMAFIALFGIVAGIIGTGVLFFFSTPSNPESKILTQDALQKLIKESSSTGIVLGDDNSIKENNSGTIIVDEPGDLGEE